MTIKANVTTKLDELAATFAEMEAAVEKVTKTAKFLSIGVEANDRTIDQLLDSADLLAEASRKLSSEQVDLSDRLDKIEKQLRSLEAEHDGFVEDVQAELRMGPRVLAVTDVKLFADHSRSEMELSVSYDDGSMTSTLLPMGTVMGVDYDEASEVLSVVHADGIMHQYTIRDRQE